MSGATLSNNGDAAGSDQLRVFVSYSRADSAFVDRFETALLGKNVVCFIDRSDIESFVDWRERVEQLIAASDAFITVLSPEFAASANCAREIEIAVSMSKRFAPIVARNIGKSAVPDAVQRINWIAFDEEDKFSANVESLVTALSTDIEWVREHTRLGELARHWETSGRPEEQLIRGTELSRALHWLTNRPRLAPEPNSSHHAYIAAAVKIRDRLRRIEWEKVSALNEKIRLLLEDGKLRGACEQLDTLVEYVSEITDSDLRLKRAEFAARAGRIDRLVRFYRHAREVYVFAGEEDFVAAHDVCRNALSILDVLDREEWWRHLPIEDLNPRGVIDLTFEVHRQLLLYTGLQLQPGIDRMTSKTKPTFDGTILLRFIPAVVLRKFAEAGGLALLPALRKQDKPEAVPFFRGALATLEKIESFELAYAERSDRPFPPSRTSHMLRKMCRILLSLASGPRHERIDYKDIADAPGGIGGSLAADELNPADYYFLGLFNFFIAKRSDATLAKIISVFQGVFPELDASTPFETAERLLRAGVSREPGNFWPHFVLGRTLLARRDFRGAELAFNVCISIDPDYARGYEQRAVSLAGQLRQAGFEELLARAESDSQRALALASGDPSTFWPRGELLQTIGNIEGALDAYASWMLLEEEVLGRLSRGTGVAKVYDLAQSQIRAGPSPALRANAEAVLAIVNWLWREDGAATAHAQRALSIDPMQTNARTILGLVHRRNGRLDEAKREFDAVLERDSCAYRALINRAEMEDERTSPDKDSRFWRGLLAVPEKPPAPPAWMRSRAQFILGGGSIHDLT
ncbi:hypothetical protein BH10PSE7_BH10PSE7_10220 [soil metagenome]